MRGSQGRKCPTQTDCLPTPTPWKLEDKVSQLSEFKAENARI